MAVAEVPIPGERFGNTSEVARPDMAQAIDTIRAGFGLLFEAGVDPADSRDAITCIEELEQLHRQADAASLKLMDIADSDALYLDDGHASATVMIRHHANLSNNEAAARQRTMKTCRTLGDVETAYTAGELGTCHIRVLGRVHSNPRVRHHMNEYQDWFINHSAESFNDFDTLCRGWVEPSTRTAPHHAPNETTRTVM